MASETKEFGSNLQTVSRAVALLRCFEQGAVSLTLAQLTRRLGLKVSGRIEGSERVFYLEWDPRSPGAPARGAPPRPDEEG